MDSVDIEIIEANKTIFDNHAVVLSIKKKNKIFSLVVEDPSSVWLLKKVP